MPTTPQGFEVRLDQLRATLVTQGRRVQAQLELAFDALFTRDQSKAAAAIAMDDEVDRDDILIEQAVVQLLTDATRESAALEFTQLRMAITIAKVNNELERIADAAVDIAELVPTIRDLPLSFPDTFRVMANSVVGILRDASTSVERADPRLAKIVLQSQHAVTAFKSAIIRDSEERIAKGQMPVEFAFRLHEIAGQCELMADHCTNIAEQVIYLTTGAVVRHTDASWVEIPGR